MKERRNKPGTGNRFVSVCQFLSAVAEWIPTQGDHAASDVPALPQDLADAPLIYAESLSNVVLLFPKKMPLPNFDSVIEGERWAATMKRTLVEIEVGHGRVVLGREASRRHKGTDFDVRREKRCRRRSDSAD